jgi:hypothetical protein
MRALLDVVLLALQLYTYLIIASAILSWLIAFNVVNTRNDFVRSCGISSMRHGAGPAADPAHPAQSRRYRCLADHPAARDLLPPAGHRLLSVPRRDLMAASAWDMRADGVEIRVRVTPRGGRDRVDGVDALSDGRAVLKVRVRARPEDGAANQAVGASWPRRSGSLPRR